MRTVPSGGRALALPGYAHRALVAAHMHNATQLGFRPGVLEELLEPWVGSEGQAPYYRQYSQLRQADTAEYEHLLGAISIPVRILWGRHDRILPPEHAEWMSNASLTRRCPGKKMPGTSSPRMPRRDFSPRSLTSGPALSARSAN